MKKPILTLVLLISTFCAFAKEKPKPENESADSTEIMVEDIEKTLKYQTGDIVIGDNLAKLKVPAGFRFLDAPQAKYIIYDVWGNPKNESENLYGLIVPEKIGVTEAGSWAFVIEYDDMGFVKDDDADKINYDDLMKEMNEGEAEANAERAKMGFSAVHISGLDNWRLGRWKGFGESRTLCSHFKIWESYLYCFGSSRWSSMAFFYRQR